ncbi:hypothetical protein, conserved in T. vivax, partial [Trypanosoma vivax Y486]
MPFSAVCPPLRSIPPCPVSVHPCACIRAGFRALGCAVTAVRVSALGCAFACRCQGAFSHAAVSPSCGSGFSSLQSMHACCTASFRFCCFFSLLVRFIFLFVSFFAASHPRPCCFALHLFLLCVPLRVAVCAMRSFAMGFLAAFSLLLLLRAQIKLAGLHFVCVPASSLRALVRQLPFVHPCVFSTRCGACACVFRLSLSCVHFCQRNRHCAQFRLTTAQCLSSPRVSFFAFQTSAACCTFLSPAPFFASRVCPSCSLRCACLLKVLFLLVFVFCLAVLSPFVRFLYGCARQARVSLVRHRRPHLCL